MYEAFILYAKPIKSIEIFNIFLISIKKTCWYIFRIKYIIHRGSSIKLFDCIFSLKKQKNVVVFYSKRLT